MTAVMKRKKSTDVSAEPFHDDRNAEDGVMSIYCSKINIYSIDPLNHRFSQHK